MALIGTIGSTIAKSVIQAGSELQVVQADLASTFSTTNVAYQDSGLSASITPSSASNKILVFLDGHGGQSDSGRSAFYNLVRNSTIIKEGDNLQIGTTGSTMPLLLIQLDSPSSTSSVTYKVQIRTDAVGTMSIRSSVNQKSSLILMEIAA